MQVVVKGTRAMGVDLDGLRSGDWVDLHAEPDNPKDPHAVLVLRHGARYEVVKSLLDDTHQRPKVAEGLRATAGTSWGLTEAELAARVRAYSTTPRGLIGYLPKGVAARFRPEHFRAVVHGVPKLSGERCVLLRLDRVP